MSTTDTIDIKNLNIQKLTDSEGYPTWRARLSVALRAMSLWGIVDGTRFKDSVLSKPEELAKWTKDNDRAMFFIMASVSDEVLMNSDHSSAKQLWDSILSAYGVAKEEKVYHVYHRIINTKMSSADNASEHVAKFKTMFQQIEAMDEKISERFKIAVLLSSLPESYNVKRQILYEKEKQTFQDVCDSVIGHVPEGHSSASESADKALAAFSGGNAKFKKRTYTGPPCKHCQKPTHSIETCYEIHGYPTWFKGKKGSGGNDANPGASMAVEKEWIFSARISEEDLAYSEMGPEDLDDELANSASLVNGKDVWVADSGASRAMTRYPEIIDDIHALERPVRFWLAGKKVWIIGKEAGTVRLKTKFGMLVLLEVLYVPDCDQNLLAHKPLIRKGCSVHYTPSGVYVCSPNGETMAFAPERLNENQWTLSDVQAILPKRDHANVASQSQMTSLTHRRFGHPGRDRFNHAIETYKIKNVAAILETYPCTPCDLSKSHREPLSKEPRAEVKEILEILHSDTWGPARITTYTGMRWVLTIIDLKSRMSWIFLLKTKSSYEAFEKFEEFKAHIEKSTGKSICLMRTDNGTEYLGPFVNRLMLWGIKHQTTRDYTSAMNGLAERLNRTLLETTRAIMKDAGDVDLRLWGEAIKTANYLRNRLPSRVLGWKTPYEVFFGKPAKIDHLRVWGSTCVMHIPEETGRSKIGDDRGEYGIFVGYSDEKRGYRVLVGNPEDGKIVTSWHVRFFEKDGSDTVVSGFPAVPDSFDANSDDESARNDNDPEQQYNTTPPETPQQIPAPSPSPAPTISTQARPPTATPSPPPEQTSMNQPRKSGRNANSDPAVKAKHLAWKHQEYDEEHVSLTLECIDNEPKTLREALNGLDKDQWKESARAEWDALERNGTFEIVKKPEGLDEADIVKSGHVFKIKRDSQGKIERYKTRVVARGYMQVEGVNYQDIFAPVARLEAFRLMLALVAMMDLELDHMDVITAFLNGILKEVVYMHPPMDGEECVWKRLPDGFVLKMLKALYGLKQAGRTWYDTIHDAFVRDYGFTRMEADHCLYLVRRENGDFILVLLFVDDLALASNSRKMLDGFKKSLMEKFEMKDLGELRWFLGMRITRDRERRTLGIDQSQYIEKMVSNYQLPTRTAWTPIEKGYEFIGYDGESQITKKYQSLIGSLMYAMCGTRPDIAYGVSTLSRFNRNPSSEHYNAAIRILKYLEGTKNIGILYGSKESNAILGYSDAAYGDDKDSRQSTAGYAFLCWGGVIAWKSKLQKTVATSSTDSEYMALGQAVKEALWIKGLVSELGFKEGNATMTILSDSMGGIDLAKTTKHHDRTKHIDIRHHFLREHIENKNVELIHVKTEFMWADTLTKPLGRIKFMACRDSMGLSEV